MCVTQQVTKCLTQGVSQCVITSSKTTVLLLLQLLSGLLVAQIFWQNSQFSKLCSNCHNFVPILSVFQEKIGVAANRSYFVPILVSTTSNCPNFVPILGGTPILLQFCTQPSTGYQLGKYFACQSVCLSVCNNYSPHPPHYIELSFSSSLCLSIYSPQDSQFQVLEEGSVWTCVAVIPQEPPTLDMRVKVMCLDVFQHLETFCLKKQCVQMPSCVTTASTTCH